MVIFDDDIFDEGEGGVPISEGTAKRGGRPMTIGEIARADGENEPPFEYRTPIAATAATNGQAVVICDDGAAFVLSYLGGPEGVQVEWVPLPSVPGTKADRDAGQGRPEAMTENQPGYVSGLGA